MKSQVIKHFTLHFQNLWIQEDVSSGSSMAICIYVQQSLRLQVKQIPQPSDMYCLL